MKTSCRGVGDNYRHQGILLKLTLANHSCPSIFLKLSLPVRILDRNPNRNRASPESWFVTTCVYYRWVIRRVKIVPTASPSSLGTNLGVHSKSPGHCLGTKLFVSQLLGHSLSLVRKWDKSCMNTVINLITLITLEETDEPGEGGEGAKLEKNRRTRRTQLSRPFTAFHDLPAQVLKILLRISSRATCWADGI